MEVKVSDSEWSSWVPWAAQEHEYRFYIVFIHHSYDTSVPCFCTTWNLFRYTLKEYKRRYSLVWEWGCYFYVVALLLERRVPSSNLWVVEVMKVTDHNPRLSTVICKYTTLGSEVMILILIQTSIPKMSPPIPIYSRSDYTDPRNILL